MRTDDIIVATNGENCCCATSIKGIADLINLSRSYVSRRFNDKNYAKIGDWTLYRTTIRRNNRGNKNLNFR